MKIIYKSASSKTQLEARNHFFCNGIEVQMLNKNEDLTILKHSKHPIHSIHYPYTNNECYLYNILKTENQHDFELTLKKANDYNSAIILHCTMQLQDIMNYDMNSIQQLINLLKLYPNVKICLENSTKFLYNSKLKDNIMQIPDICDYLNNICNKKVFYPLLDICHLVSCLNSYIAYPGYSIKDAIIKYNSDYYNIHFNYANGIGKGSNHGVTFRSNQILLEKIIDLLLQINPNVNLILEVQESDFISCQNVLELHTDILKILTKKDSLNLIEKSQVSIKI